MNLLPYIEHLHRQLLAAADAGGDDARALAERLVAPLEAATRLVLLDALSNAASDITRELAPGSVDVRLRGTDPEFVVTPAVEQASFASVGAGGTLSQGTEESEDVNISRTTLRLPEHVKTRVEQAAARDGLSVNTWLVRAISTALETDHGRRPFGEPTGEQSFTGWARS
jgi:hypothetical protein